MKLKQELEHKESLIKRQEEEAKVELSDLKMEVDECSKPMIPTQTLKAEQSGLGDLLHNMFDGNIE